MQCLREYWPIIFRSHFPLQWMLCNLAFCWLFLCVRVLSCVFVYMCKFGILFVFSFGTLVWFFLVYSTSLVSLKVCCNCNIAQSDKMPLHFGVMKKNVNVLLSTTAARIFCAQLSQLHCLGMSASFWKKPLALLFLAHSIHCNSAHCNVCVLSCRWRCLRRSGMQSCG